MRELTEYDKFMLVNRSKTVDDLIEVVNLLENNGGIANNMNYVASELVSAIRYCYEDEAPYDRVTRTYGIRQQLMYIMYYEGKMHLL